MRIFIITYLTAFLVSCATTPLPVAHTHNWKAPSLSAPAQNGKMVNIQQATSGPWAAVFFYPKADTPG